MPRPARGLDELADLLRVCAHPVRLRILVELTAAPKTLAEVAIAAGVPPAAAVVHLRALSRAGLVRAVRRGRVLGYAARVRVRSGRLGRLRATFVRGRGVWVAFGAVP
jgi:DNA-binding transcriptional ArsR family regulator